MTKPVRINPRRWARLIQMLQSGSCVDDATVVDFDYWVLKLGAGETITVITRLPGYLHVSELTPAVQSFISRVPLSPAPDSQQSDADDSDTAQSQSGGCASRCEGAQVSSSEEQSSSPAVGSSRSDVGEDAPSASDESSKDDSSDANGHAQADSRETGEPQPGSPPDAGASAQEESVQAGNTCAGKASSVDAPADEEGTDGHAQGEPASSLPAGEVSSVSVVEAATENKGLNPFRIPSLRRWEEHGGVFARLSDDAQPSRELVARARAVFARMIRGGEGSPGACWRASRVAVKTAGYMRQWSIHDRRLGEGRPALLVLSDVSGSMSAYAKDVLRFAVAVSCIGLPGGEIVAVAQSNGIPEEVLRGGRVTDCDWRKAEDDPLSIYMSIIRAYDVRAVVIAADHDGEEVYRAIYQQTTAHMYWLHAYLSAKAEQVTLARPGHGLWPSWAHPSRLRMAYGCGSAERALEAMERMLIAAP